MIRVFIYISILLFIGCGSSSKITLSNYHGYKLVLQNLFKNIYLWSDRVDFNIDLSKISSPQEMIDTLKYKPKDRWSFAITKEENSKLFSPNEFGFGFAYTLIDGNLTVFYIRIDSPADNADLKRGDIILKIDDKTPTPSIISDSFNLDRDVKFTVYRRGDILDIYIKPQEYSFKFTKREIINEDIGYLRLDMFSPNAINEIDEAFYSFKKQNIKNLIIDLRYNSGGSIVMASILLDKLVRNLDGAIQFRLRWNEKYRKRDYIYRFETDNNSLNLEKIIFLTTKITASASEAVINALKPYIEVITIGDKTYGKPVGMEGVSDKFYVYYLINFKIENSEGCSDYFDGLDVTCKSQDDLTHELGDVNETMLKDALFFIRNGECKIRNSI